MAMNFYRFWTFLLFMLLLLFHIPFNNFCCIFLGGIGKIWRDLWLKPHPDLWIKTDKSKSLIFSSFCAFINIFIIVFFHQPTIHPILLCKNPFSWLSYGNLYICISIYIICIYVNVFYIEPLLISEYMGIFHHWMCNNIKYTFLKQDIVKMS